MIQLKRIKSETNGVLKSKLTNSPNKSSLLRQLPLQANPNKRIKVELEPEERREV